jgi:hypothetical protein
MMLTVFMRRGKGPMNKGGLATHKRFGRGCDF